MRKEVLRMANVTGNETDLTNLNNMSFNIFRGEILGLIPINGCGRMNLLKLLSRNVPIKSGLIYINEKLANSYQFSDGRLNPVYLLEQKSKLIPEFSVLDNIYVLQKGFRKFYYNRSKMRRQFCWLCDSMGVEILPDVCASDLSPYERCVVEIMKGIVQGAKLIVMNGIGENISGLQLKKIKRIMTALISQGVSFLYICNNYEEIISTCSRILFMKDGTDLKIFDRSEFGEEWFQKMAQSLLRVPKAQQQTKARVIFEVKNLKLPSLEPITLKVREGKCTVIYDQNRILGSVLEGWRKCSAEILLEEHKLSGKELERMLGKEIMFLAPDPLKTMIYPDLSSMENLNIGLGKKTGNCLIKKRISKSVELEYSKLLGNCLDKDNIMENDIFELYKLIYYRIQLQNPKVVMIAYPFKNTDINLREHIVELLLMLKSSGIGMVLISVDINASMLVADDLWIMENGRLTEQYEAKDFASIKVI